MDLVDRGIIIQLAIGCVEKSLVSYNGRKQRRQHESPITAVTMTPNMEPLDGAYQRFCSFVDGLAPDFWGTIKTEADVRMKIIDRIMVGILGWPEKEINLESVAGDGYIDYRLTVEGLNRLIVEAKKEARDLDVPADHVGRYFKLDGAVFKSEAAKEGIEQAIRYCGRKNAELACVTNGRQWFVFRGNRLGDGKDSVEGPACVFGSLEGINDKEKFRLFYDLLSYDAVAAFRYRALFREAEGQPVRSHTFRAPARRQDSRQFIDPDQLARDLDRIMLSFFRDLSGEDDADARRTCFVETSESLAAEQNLARISEELRNRVKAVGIGDGSEITQMVRRVQEMQRQELVLLVGTKGSGKSTFIERFFEEVLPHDLAGDCVIVKIDLSKCGCDSATIIKWLDHHFLEAAEKATFGDNPPTYDDLQGMFWKEYDRWRVGHAKHLYETDKNAFKIQFGAHVEKRREERPHEYIVHLLHRIVGGMQKIPCLIFDNADHFDVPFQEEVFKYAHSLYTECLSLVIVPITDTTSWQLAREGPMQSFYTESFYLPTPPVEHVLKKRIDYIDAKIADEKPEAGRGYFLGKGIPLEIDNIKAFTACLQKLFLNTGQVPDWIGRLANHDIRRCLQLTREIVASPYMKVHDLLKAFLNRTSMEVSPEDIKLAIIRGKYDIYPADNNAFVQNVFDMTPSTDTSPLIAVRILQFLDSTWSSNPENDSRYVPVQQLIDYFHEMNFEPHVIKACLEQMLKAGLCLSYDPTAKSICDVVKLEVSAAGRQHLMWALRDWVFLESMAEVTSLLDSDCCSDVKASLASGEPHRRRAAIRSFVTYLIREDKTYCIIPSHELYRAQNRILESLGQEKESLGAVPNGVVGRFSRLIGPVSRWDRDAAWGFIKPNVFIHISDVPGTRPDEIHIGSVIEYDVVATDRGPKAVRAVLLK